MLPQISVAMSAFSVDRVLTTTVIGTGAAADPE
jgi:hypothetical protein